MRTDRLLEVADAIEANPQYFDMLEWVQVDGKNVPDHPGAIREWKCGTTACVAGWACHLWIDEAPEGDFDVVEVAQGILGLSEDEGDKLFFLTDWDTPALAAAGLRTIVATGEIPDPWDHGDEED